MQIKQIFKHNDSKPFKKIKKILNAYNRLSNISFVNKHPSIIALNKLSSSDWGDIFKLYECFVEKTPVQSDKAYKVYKAILKELSGHTETKQSKYNPEKTENILSIFNKNGLLTRDNISSMYGNCRDRISGQHFFSTFKILERGNLLKDNFPLLRDSEKKVRLAGLFCLLDSVALLTKKNKTVLLEHPLLSYDLYTSLKALNRHELLTQDNFDMVTADNSPREFVESLLVLKEASLLTEENTALLRSSSSSSESTDQSSLLRELNKHKLLTQHSFNNFINPRKNEKKHGSTLFPPDVNQTKSSQDAWTAPAMKRTTL